MPSGLILAVDQGTTNTKALLVDRTGRLAFRTSSPVALLAYENGFVEQDPLALWESVREVIQSAVVQARQAGAVIEAIAISNQRETTLAWQQETGQPLATAVSWQCGRSATICNRLAAHSNNFRARTGLPLAPLISAGKWAWLLENVSTVQAAAAKGALLIGTVDVWLIHQLTSGVAHSTDFTNASRTGLLNLETLRWDPDLLSL